MPKIEPSAKPRVVHFIWSVPHYRRPVFRRLAKNRYLDFVVCAGDNARMFGGADVRIVAVADGSDSREIKMHTVRSWRLRRGIFKEFEWQPGAVLFLLRNKFDAVICLGNKSFSNMLIRLICKARGIPLLEWTQGVKRPEKGVKWFLLKRFYQFADGLLLYGTRARDFFSTHGFAVDQLFVVNNSLDYDCQVKVRESISAAELAEVRKRYGVTGEKGRLLFFSGRLEKRSCLPLLFEALKITVEDGLDIRLVVIGDGSCREEYAAVVQNLGIEKWVTFIGACYDEAVLAKIMMAADLCVLPGPAGLGVIHSLVYGTPVLTRRGWGMGKDEEFSASTFFEPGPEVEAVRPGISGDFYESGNVGSLVGKLKTMLYPEPCKLRMAEFCRQIIAENYTPEFQERVIITALNRVLPENRKIPLST